MFISDFLFLDWVFEFGRSEIFFFYLFVFGLSETGIPSRSGWLYANFIAHTGLELANDPPGSASRVLGLHVYATTPSLAWNFHYVLDRSHLS